MWVNYQFMLVCPLDLTLVPQSSTKMACFCLFLDLPYLLPQLANFLHGYIRHIRDILQLKLGNLIIKKKGQTMSLSVKKLHFGEICIKVFLCTSFIVYILQIKFKPGP